MKSRIKFRITQEGGKVKKFAMNLDDGEVFSFDDTTLGFTSPESGPTFHCKITVKNQTLLLEREQSVEPLSVNGKLGDVFTLKPGDLLNVGKSSVEFIELPVTATAPTEVEEPATQFIDLKGTQKQIDVASQATLAEGDTADAEANPTQYITPEQKASVTSPQAAAESSSTFDYAPATSQVTAPVQRKLMQRALTKDDDDDSGFDYTQLTRLTVLTRMGKAQVEKMLPRTDLGRKVALGTLATVVVTVFSVLLYLGTRKTNFEKPAPEYIPPQASQSAPVSEPQNQAPAGPNAAQNTVPTSVQSVAPGQPQTAQVQQQGGAQAGITQDAQQAQPVAPQSIAQKFNQLKVNDSLVGMQGNPKDSFFSAVREGNMRLVKEIVDSRKVDVNFTLESGTTALMQAAFYGQTKIAQYLLAQRANPNAQDPSGATPLMFAVQGNRVEVAELLLKHGANPDVKKDGAIRAIDIARYNHHSKLIGLVQFYSDKRRIASTKKKTKKKPSRYDRELTPFQ
jgi:hypothetical protein